MFVNCGKPWKRAQGTAANPPISASEGGRPVTVALEDLRDEIRREELSAGLSTERPLTRAEIDHRRRQIAEVGLLVFFGVVVSTLRANVWGNVHQGLFDPDLLRAATITAAGG